MPAIWFLSCLTNTNKTISLFSKQKGIDRNSVSFGAWSGLVELRGVALRAEALAVLFESLGIDIPVTVEAGFIGLLRLVVPWKTIGSTPVKIELEDVNIIARPVRDDGSDDSEIKIRERRIKRAKLNTDDAVREASWNMGNEDSAKRVSTWSWFVSDDLLAKVVANIQIELRDLVLRFEDPFSNAAKPYAVAIRCKTLKAFSANESWDQVFIDDIKSPRTRKLVIVDGFHMDWFPLNTTDLQRYSKGGSSDSENKTKYTTPEELQNYIQSEHGNLTAPSVLDSSSKAPTNLISPISGSLRLDLSQSEENLHDNIDSDDSPSARATVDVRFPNISMKLDDVQYASLVQTSLYFSKLSIRGYSPKTPKERWIWAVEQLLPGFRGRRARESAFTEDGIAKRREERLLYISLRQSLLKARRTNSDEQESAHEELDPLEDSIPFDQIIRYRDIVDEKCLELSKNWTPAPASTANPSGTTMSYLWSRLGYNTGSNELASEQPTEKTEASSTSGISTETTTMKHLEADLSADDVKEKLSRTPNVQISFHLRRGSIRLIEGGYPGPRKARVDLMLRDLIVGAKRFQSGGFLMEALLGSIEAWDVENNVRMVYSRVPRNLTKVELDEDPQVDIKSSKTSYPTGVANALLAIRSGFETTNVPLTEEDGDAEYLNYSTEHGSYHGPVASNEDDIDGIYTPSNVGIQNKQNLIAWANSAADYAAHSTHRVTEAEFFGKGRDEHFSSLPYISAVQIYRKQGGKSAQTSNQKQTHVVAAVGQLEAVVDGPKGSFLWALRFWKPKGLRQDPIISFLGAAAGARIAELRMELEEAVLQDRLPLQLDALIRAPRFIIPGRTADKPAIVVNMGTLGIQTSENESQTHSVSSLTGETPLGNYSNYALSLDDLGVYIAPNESMATSSTRRQPMDLTEGEGDLEGETDYGGLETPIDVRAIERLIRPLSMRFFVQVLRDPSSVQAASQAANRAESSGRISRLRLRGQMPGLWLIISQKAFKHILSSSKHWSRELLPPKPIAEPTEVSTSEIQPLMARDHKEQGNISAITKLASYDCRVAIDHVSLELRDKNDRRLVTAVAAGMCASLVKTKHLCMDTEFTLKSWTITDGSRGSTAPFRRLVYAGTGAEVRGVSPPRSSTSSHRSRSLSFSDAPVNDTNFVTIKHTLHFKGREQTVDIHFLSLNLIFVRETVLKIASFFEVIRDSNRIVKQFSQSSVPSSAARAEALDKEQAKSLHTQIEVSTPTLSSGHGKVSLRADFDGFRIQFVSSEGAVCSVETRDFSARLTRDVAGEIHAAGDVRYFAVDDLTASLKEHQSLIRYERANYAIGRMFASTTSASVEETHGNTQVERLSDGWDLSFPFNPNSDVLFRTRLKGLQIRYLARFTSVMGQYFSALAEALKKSVLAAELEASAIIEQSQKQTTALIANQTRSFTFEVDLSDVSLTLPRHSGNADEAILLSMPIVHIHNVDTPAVGFKTRIRVSLPNLQASVQYRVQEGQDDSFIFTSDFLSETAAEIELDVSDMAEYREVEVSSADTFRSTSPLVQARFNIMECLSLHLCEAQYSVLYFVLTENLVEGIPSDSMSLERDEWNDSIGNPESISDLTTSGYENLTGNIDPSVLSDENNSRRKAPVASLAFRIPLSKVTMSRGWNVLDDNCQIMGMTNRDVFGNIVYGQSELVVELHSTIQSLTDLRVEHSIGTRTFAYPLESEESDSEALDIEKLSNFSLAYSKAYGQRASIEVSLTNVQLKVVPELFRDMSFLVVPGWPFLSTSDFAPPCAYLGRTMTVSVSDSQVLLCADEFENDSRGLVLSGRFLTRIEWMPSTGAKIVSIQSSGLQVGLEYRLEHQELIGDEPTDIKAKRFSDRDSLILYPSDAHVEYFGPGVDHNGTRTHIEAESILCRINVGDAPSIFAILRRLGRLENSHLSSRQWKHPSVDDQGVPKQEVPIMDSKTRARERASKSMAISYSTPAARILFTDQSEGRFVPILELNLETVRADGNMPNLAKIAMQLSVNLFSRRKGWWKPALEPWHVEASLSQGVSGSKAFVIKSEDTLNLNVTPDSILSAREVSSSLRSIKDKANSFLATMQSVRSEDRKIPVQDSENDKEMSGPSVAAFHVRNQLGLPIEIFVPISTERSSLLNDREFEVHMPVERLLPSNRSTSQRNENFSRHDTLKCQISISGYSPLELSAAEVGNHGVTFLPVKATTGSSATENYSDRPNSPVFAVWEIEMVQGVPICTIRSAVQVVNRTSTVLEVCLQLSPLSHSESINTESKFSTLTLGNEDIISTVNPGRPYSIPLVAIQRLIRIRPAHTSSVAGGEHEDDSSVDELADDAVADFYWSDPINGWEWLKMANSPYRKQQKNGKTVFSDKASEQGIEHEVVRCRSLRSGGPDFFIAAVPESYSQGSVLHGCRLDIAFQAPLTFTNRLPGRISYRISEAQSIDRSWNVDDSNCAILGAGVVSPLESAHIHCTDDTQNLSGISIAFENRPVECPGESLPIVSEIDRGIPTRFGAFVSLSSILNGQATVLPTVEPSANRSKFEMGAAVHVATVKSRVPCFDLYAPFWLRNRSDVNLEVSSRSSFYAKGCNPVQSIGYPKGKQAGRFLCFDGPYIALRCKQGHESINSSDQWWVCPSDLRDLSAAVSVSLPKKSLLLEVRQARGYGSLSFAVTIRNAAFVINNSDRHIQWCQTSDLDSHGNCPFRHVQLLMPYEEATIHWTGSKSLQSINIRLSAPDCSSDWIWSPALPLLLGNAGEVSAKMYRPKTQEQYIARIQSSKLDGGARALMILSEDRQNPPYRIVNHCKTRSIAFHQFGSQERPWLVRPGRSTRYSWDDPLAPAHKRKLQIDVLDNNSASVSVPAFSDAGYSRATSGGRPYGGPSMRDRGNARTSSSKSTLQILQVNIDIVLDSTSELGSSYLGISYSVTMEGATKIVSFRDTGDVMSYAVPVSSPKLDAHLQKTGEDPEVPVVLWDEFKSASLPTSPMNTQGAFDDILSSNLPASSEVSIRTPATSDYALKAKDSSVPGLSIAKSMDIDAAFYLASAGISIVTSEPVELLYMHANNLHMTFEAYDSLQCFAFHVSDLQIDNQLDNPPFPVSLWADSQVVNIETGQIVDDAQARTVAIELKRVVTDSGILMLKSFRAGVRPLNLRIDENLVSHIISFVNDITSLSRVRRTEVLQGDDGEHLNILTRMETKDRDQRSSTFKKIKTSFKSVQRIYVEDFKLYDTQIVLSSSISRGSSASRSLAYGPALRPLVGFLMNLENCEFTFSALELRHLFSSKSHFVSLIRQFYETQLSNQKMKIFTSNSLVGNPAALFDSVAIGARDLFSEPGRAKGGGEFLFGVGRGSKSLITHTVGGIVGSISGIPKAVSSGLETAVGDEAYLAERERIRGSQLSGGRRMASSNPAQGVVTGVFSLAHGISSGVTGLFRDPVQGAMQGGASGFFKGVRKGLVGGVVKPVAGVIDLIAEPVAVISKNINETGSERRQGQIVPKRPPRTFWGESKRLVTFDLRIATGESLYKGVQLNCGVSYSAVLFDWVELSDRNERTDSDAAEWIWNVVRARTRAMSRPRRGLRGDRPSSNLNASNDLASQIRPEKTRVALLTTDNVLIVTLDCKLILTIPLWHEASFSLEASGKDLVLVTQMDRKATPSSGSSIIAETQNLFTAPWDAASATRRRKPNPGETVRDRISCGSIGAREKLCDCVLRLLESKQRRNQHSYVWTPALRRPPSAIELPVMPATVDDDKSLELSSTKRSDASDGSAGVFVLPMRSPGRKADGDPSEKRSDETSSAPFIRKESKSQLDSSIRRLSMSGTSRALDARRSIRIIVTNEVESCMPLLLVRSALERGYWRVAVPQRIEPYEAAMFEVDSGSMEEIKRLRQKGGKDVLGSVLFRLSEQSNLPAAACPQALLEFASPSSGSPKYGAKTVGGLVASYERGNGMHATVVFRIRVAQDQTISRSLPEWDNNSQRGSMMMRASGKFFGRGSSSRAYASSEHISTRHNPTASGVSETFSVDDRSVSQLLDLGFTLEDAVNALKKSKGDVVKAIDILTE